VLLGAGKLSAQPLLNFHLGHCCSKAASLQGCSVSAGACSQLGLAFLTQLRDVMIVLSVPLKRVQAD